jgi:hypothetical protein
MTDSQQERKDNLVNAATNTIDTICGSVHPYGVLKETT